MSTIKREIKISGNGLMKNQECTVSLTPSDKGIIRFFVGDNEPFEANINNVTDTNHCVVMGQGKAKTMLSEHFMAACAICEINSLDVHLSTSEFPILDGSSKEWVELFNQAGIAKDKQKNYTVSEPVYYLNGKTHLVILPDDKLTISYAVNYDHKDLKNCWAHVLDKKDLKEIIEARTFGFLKDLKKYQLFGYAKGVTIENTVGLKDDGTYTTTLRSEREPTKHKILDLIGDLYLTGYNPLNLKAQIIVKEAGHAVHTKVAKILQDKIIEYK